MDLATYKERVAALPYCEGEITLGYEAALGGLVAQVLTDFGLGPLDSDWCIVTADWKEVTELVKEMHDAEKKGFEYLMPVEPADLPSGQGDDLIAICSKVPLEREQAIILADLYYNLGTLEEPLKNLDFDY